MADDTAGLMRTLGVKPAHIVGTSMGGRIALELALRHPELVKRLVLVSTSARGSQRRWLVRLLGLLTVVPIFRSKYPQPYYAHVRQREASFACNRADRLHELQIPTAILHGHNDRIVPYWLAEKMHAGITGSTMVTFKGGHTFFLMAECRQFIDAATTFLS